MLVDDIKKLTQDGIAAMRQKKFNNQLKKQLSLVGVGDDMSKAKKKLDKELSSI